MIASHVFVKRFWRLGRSQAPFRKLSWSLWFQAILILTYRTLHTQMLRRLLPKESPPPYFTETKSSIIGSRTRRSMNNLRISTNSADSHGWSGPIAQVAGWKATEHFPPTAKPLETQVLIFSSWTDHGEMQDLHCSITTALRSGTSFGECKPMVRAIRSKFRLVPQELTSESPVAMLSAPGVFSPPHCDRHGRYTYVIMMIGKKLWVYWPTMIDQDWS